MYYPDLVVIVVSAVPRCHLNGEFLLDKQLLLVLDNCEHLIAACSVLVESFLKSSQGIKILATSREALNISGETAWRVPSLSLPDIARLSDITELSHYDAINLFADRTQNCRPSFNLTLNDAEAIAGICHRLNGIPLAIELAAARIKLLNPRDILQRLDNRFQLLTGGIRTAIERQKTLRANVDWSYDLLSEHEKLLINRLTVFVGGCDLQAAEYVCAEAPLSADDILDLLSSLIDKSLVVTNTEKTDRCDTGFWKRSGITPGRSYTNRVRIRKRPWLCKNWDIIISP